MGHGRDGKVRLVNKTPPSGFPLLFNSVPSVFDIALRQPPGALTFFDSHYLAPKFTPFRHASLSKVKERYFYRRRRGFRIQCGSWAEGTGSHKGVGTLPTTEPHCLHRGGEGDECAVSDLEARPDQEERWAGGDSDQAGADADLS